MIGADPPFYACGHGAAELERLERQGAFYAEITRAWLVRAGLASGMRVLDLGCGAGDVTLLAGELVGASGQVLGVDRAPEALSAARARAASRRMNQVTFALSEIEAVEVPAPVDALVGRFVLMHQPEPARVLRAAARHVRNGGLVAMLESCLAASVPGVHSWPHAEVYHRVMSWITRALAAAGAHTDMGLRLDETFRQAGLPRPVLWLQARVEGGPDAAIYRYITESLRSLLPLAERHGIVRLTASDVDALEDQLRQEAESQGGVLTSPVVVGAWCRV